ncbi:uncharacterized protein KY384_006538 [Bacidia gigantensis]|uniref:uncharacterized protein n=1 Tax=Bacidia gigantensis TaxID=2732470 RepID=UPI001D03CC8A|nr:uncharacterized protein KY384_006538 [Bacidia gigantensis]KAG8528849.1 hypothetical protein KY384_006538 [Bacidia gigantensis]
MVPPQLPDTMLAVRVEEFHQPYSLRQIPTPSPSNLGPNDLLLKVGVASYCHTDSMVIEGEIAKHPQITASHEAAGTVLATGSSATDFPVGSRVMVGVPFHRCGSCAECQGSEEYKQYCTNGDYFGVTTDGGFAEYAIADAREACVLPDAVGFDTAAPLACAGCTVWRGVLRADLKEGQWLGIVGAGGGLGHLGVQFAKALGLKVVGIDAKDLALELARECGADVVVDARKGTKEVVEAVKGVTGGEGVEVAINVSGADEAAALSCAMTRVHGTVIQLAQPTEVKIPYPELIFRDIRIKGSLISTKQEAERMLQTVADHNVKVQTNFFFGLEEVPKLVDFVHAGKMAGKGIVVVDEEEQRRIKQAKH